MLKTCFYFVEIFAIKLNDKTIHVVFLHNLLITKEIKKQKVNYF